jgi:hypothetical protein
VQSGQSLSRALFGVVAEVKSTIKQGVRVPQFVYGYRKMWCNAMSEILEVEVEHLGRCVVFVWRVFANQGKVPQG